jgi:hypothetical protein
MSVPEQYPLTCSFRDLIAGHGYVAGVALDGRVLAERRPAPEGDGETWWVYGVYPGAAAGTGASLGAAVADFRNTVKKVLIELAHEAVDFRAFERGARTFFGETDDLTAKEWEEARARVREGGVGLPNLKVVKRVDKPKIEVVLRHELRPEANAVADAPALAA